MRTHKIRVSRRRTKSAAIQQLRAAKPSHVAADELLPLHSLQHNSVGLTERESGKFITSVVDVETHLRREAILTRRARPYGGRRGQPPMLDRLRIVIILADRLV